MNPCHNGEQINDAWLMRGFETDSSAWTNHYSYECEQCYEYMLDLLERKCEVVTRNNLLALREERVTA